MNHIKRLLSRVNKKFLISHAPIFVAIILVAVAIALPEIVSAASDLNVNAAVAASRAASSTPQNVKWMDTIFLFMAQVALFCVNFLGKLIVLITEIVLVNIMSYNNFGSSAVIGAGWAIVRDMMNMGFVIVLLIIAMVTIFGGHVGSWQVKWQKEVVNLLFFAILINFSRTICVFLIDIGQVFMLTFANAIKDIAGGNFLQLFGLSDFLRLDPEAIQQLVGNNKGLSAFNLLTAASLALIMSLVVFGTMLILTVVLVYRIVVLWILVVLSPLAFFFGGAAVLRQAAGDPYSDWWKRFTGAVAIGPVLVFFLWLTLSVAGSGNIAATEGFPTGASPETLGEFGNVTGFVTSIANPGRLLSFIISMGMLYAGFEAANKFSSSIPGLGGKLLKGGVSGALKLGAGATIGAGLGAGLMAGKFAGKAAVKTGKAGMWVGGKGIKFAGKTKAGQKFRESIGKGLTEFGDTHTGFGWMARVGTSLEQSRRQEAAGRLGEAGKAVANYNKDENDGELARTAITPDGVMKQQAIRQRILTNKFLRSKYDSNDLEKMTKDFVDNGGKNTIEGDSAMSQSWASFQEARPDLMPEADRKTLLGNMTNEQLLKVDPDVARNADYRDELKNRNDTLTGKSLFEMVKGGQGGNSTLRRVLAESQKGSASEVVHVDPAKISDEGLRTLDPKKQTKGTINALIAHDAATKPNPGEGKMEILMQNSQFNIASLPAGYIRDNASKVVKNVAPEKVKQLFADPTKGDALRTGLEKAIVTRSFAQGVDEEEAKKTEMNLRVTLVSNLQGGGEELEVTNGGYNSELGRFQGDSGKGREAFTEAVKRDPTMLRNYKDDIDKGGDIGQIAAEHADVSKLIRTMHQNKTKDPGLSTEITELLNSIDVQIDEKLKTAEGKLKQKLIDRQRQITKALS